jgi:hypothetical protein
MGLRPTKRDENRVASRLAGSRRLLSRCMRPLAGALQHGAYMPTKDVGTYAPPILLDDNRIFDPEALSQAHGDAADL